MGALPIVGSDLMLKGVVTDQDLVRKVVARGRDAETFPAGDPNQTEPVPIGADDSAADVLATMIHYTNCALGRSANTVSGRLSALSACASCTRV